VKSKRGKNHQLSELIMDEKFYIPFQSVLFPALKTQKRQGPVSLIRPFSVPACPICPQVLLSFPECVLLSALQH
jgi:hypothetical protein